MDAEAFAVRPGARDGVGTPTGGIRERYGLGVRPVILCAARLVPRKGQDTLIRALPAVLRAVPCRTRRRGLGVEGLGIVFLEAAAAGPRRDTAAAAALTAPPERVPYAATARPAPGKLEVRTPYPYAVRHRQ